MLIIKPSHPHLKVLLLAESVYRITVLHDVNLNPLCCNNLWLDSGRHRLHCNYEWRHKQGILIIAGGHTPRPYRPLLPLCCYPLHTIRLIERDIVLLLLYCIQHTHVESWVRLICIRCQSCNKMSSTDLLTAIKASLCGRLSCGK